MTSGAPVVFGELPPTALLGRPETVVDGHGQRMGTQYAVVDALDLIASNNADGTTVAEYATGAPGKLRSVAGNGRTAGLQAAYQLGTAQRYRQELAGDAAALGVDAQALATMQRPVLVRVMQGADVTRDMGDRTNITATQKLSPLEQAGNDARRLDVGTLAFDEGGNPTPDSIKGFVSAMPVAERGDMLNPDGTPTRQAVDRLMAATFKQAYESDELVQLYAQATDPDARAVMAAAADASGVLANLKGAGEFDVRGAVADAAKMAVNAARQGLKLSDVLQNQDLDMSPEAYPVAAYLAQHIRTPKKMAEGLRRWGQLALEQARIADENTHQGSLLGPRPTLSRPEIFARLGSEANPTGQGIAPAAPAPQPAPEQAALVPQAPAQAAPTAAERHPTWRKNAIQAGRVARALGLEPKGKRLAQIVAEIDARDSEQNQAVPPANPAQEATENVAVRLAKDEIPGESSALAAKQRWEQAKADEVQQPAPSANDRPASWFVVDKSTGEIVMETSNKAAVDALNTSKYEAFEAYDYLAGLNRSIKRLGDNPDKRRVLDDVRAAAEDRRVAKLYGDGAEQLATPAQAATDSGADAQGAGAMFSRAGNAGTEAERHFKETERAYGGRAAYDRAKAADKTRLTYGQWVQVRTPKFKAWLGDWEAVRAQQRLNAMEPVKVRVPDAWRGLEHAELREKMAQELDRMVRDKVEIEHPELGAIRVGRVGAKKSQSTARDPAKMLVAADLESLIPAAIYARSTQPSEKEQGVDGYSTLLTRVNVDGVPLIASFSIRQQRDGAWYYNAVALYDANETARDSYGPSGALSRPLDEAPIAGLHSFIRRSLERVNPDAVSKVVDPQTGEPLVMYHGTQDNFSVFDTDNSRMGPAAWFTPNKLLASGHAKDGIVMPVYLSIKRPYEAKNATEASLITADRKAELISLGYDGIHEKRGAIEQWVAFYPEQVKSATGNNGEFDGTNSDIRFSRAQQPMSPDLARAILALGSPPKQSTKESVRAAVRELVNGLGLLPNRLGRIVVATSAEIKQDWEPLIGPTGMEASGDAGRAQGFYDPKSKTVFLIADNILQGDELGVVAHELMHKHGPAVLGEEGWNRLHGALGGWAKAKVGSMERIVYDEAARRVRASGPELSTQELFPYAVQVALEMGVRPNAVAPQGTVERWLGQVRAALRTVWEKITRKPELFKSQDLVNLAFGIAQRENPATGTSLDALGATVLDAEGPSFIELNQMQGRPDIDARPSTQSKSTLPRDGLGAGSMASGGTVPSLDRPTRQDSTERGGPAGAGGVGSLAAIPSADNIQFSRAAPTANPGAAGWAAPSASQWDDFVYKLQDKHIDTKRVLESIRATGKAIADDLDVYLQEELYHGRAAKRTQDFVSNELEPLMKYMADSGLKMQDVQDYLHARHAKEANRVVAQRNPGLPDGGSGMTDAEADAVLASFNAIRRAQLERAAARVDAMIAGTRQAFVAYGLESQDTVDAWAKTFAHYVPLMREQDGDGMAGLGTGQGFSIKGREVKGRTGSTRKVVDILANIAMQRERAIVRGEKNRVATALVGLAKDNPSALWQVDVVPTRQTLDKKTGMVTTQHDPLYKQRDNVVVAKIPALDKKTGKVVVKEHAVVFNEVDALSPLSPDTPDYIESDVIYLSGMCPEIRAPGNIRVLYRKTPETGGGFLDIMSEDGEFSHRFLIDFSGVRRAETVVPDLPPTPWNNVSIF